MGDAAGDVRQFEYGAQTPCHAVLIVEQAPARQIDEIELPSLDTSHYLLTVIYL